MTGNLSRKLSLVSDPASFRNFETVGLVCVTYCPQDEPIHLEIHLCQQNVEAFEQSLLDISTPSHIKYGQHLSREETNKLLRPSDEATTAILKTLHENSIHVVSQQQDYMQFTTTVGVANKLFNANFSWFSTDSYGKESVLRTLQYSLPDQLLEHVDFVEPTIKFPGMQ